MVQNDVLKKKSKKKQMIIAGIVVAVVLVIIIGLTAIDKLKKIETKNLVTETFEITEESGIKVKGSSVISKEQRVMADKSKGDIKDVKVKDKQEVKAGDVLFSYYNTTLEEQIEQLNGQIAVASEKITRSNLALSDANTKLRNDTKALQAIPQETTDPSLMAKRAELAEKIQVNQGKVEAETMTVQALKDSQSDLNTQKNSLSKNLNEEVKAEIDGIVYIDDNGKNDPTKVYMNIVSKEPLVKGQVSEFDVESIKVGDEVSLRVVSNESVLKGTVTAIDEIPSVGADGKGSGYAVHIKPEKNIRFGFSVEIAINSTGISIPKDYVYEEDSKLYVAKGQEDGLAFEKVEVQGTLDGDVYKINDYSSLQIGDKLASNPSEVLKEGN